MAPEIPPAPLDLRLKAGVLDLAILLFIIVLYFTVPLMLGGLTLPMWGVFAAVVGYSVIPLAVYRATLGMKLFGVELRSVKDGRGVQVIDLLFRELVGRGYFPVAYLAALLAGLIGSVLGIARFAMPMGFGAVLFHISWMLLAATVLGHFLVLTRPDRRSLADLLARSIVTPRRPEPLPEDEDDRLEALRARSGRIRTFVIAEIVILLMGTGLPWLLTRRTPGESTSSYAERLKRQRLEHQFQQDPANEALARELIWSWVGAGEPEEADRVRATHDAARREREQKREASLRERIAANPKDRQAVGLLLDLLEEQGRLEDARVAYKAWLDADFSVAKQAGYATWLYQNDFTQEAIVEFTAAFDAGFEDPYSLAYRGYAYRELGQLAEARADFERALELDPSIEQVADALLELSDPP